MTILETGELGTKGQQMGGREMGDLGVANQEMAAQEVGDPEMEDPEMEDQVEEYRERVHQVVSGQAGAVNQQVLVTEHQVMTDQM